MKYNDKHWSEELMAYEAKSQKAEERYQLEKAALDDAFLFDALDGYTNHNQAQSDDAVQPGSAKQSASMFSMRNIAVAASLLLLVGIVGYMQQQSDGADTYAQVETTDTDPAPIAMTTPVNEAESQQTAEAESTITPVERQKSAAKKTPAARVSKPVAKTEAAQTEVAKVDVEEEALPLAKKRQKIAIDGVAIDDEVAIAADMDEKPTVTLSQGDNAIAGLAMPKKSQGDMTLADGGAIGTDVNIHKSNVTPPGGWESFDATVKSEAAKLSDKQARPVVVSFRIAADGTVSDVKAVKTSCIACAERAVNLISKSGKWTNKTGKPYNMQYSMRI